MNEAQPPPQPDSIATQAKVVMAMLAERFQGKPLKVGIKEDLKAAYPNVPDAVIKRALGRHCGSARYLKTLAKGGPRYDMNGTTSGEVSPEAQETARQELADRTIAMNAKKAALYKQKIMEKQQATEKAKAEQEAARAAKKEEKKKAWEAKQSAAKAEQEARKKASRLALAAAKQKPDQVVPRSAKPAPAIVVKKKRTIEKP